MMLKGTLALPFWPNSWNFGLSLAGTSDWPKLNHRWVKMFFFSDVHVFSDNDKNERGEGPLSGSQCQCV